ncbi:MAG: alpha/beta fold hydrolase [Vicinamibacterales bacterium]
MNAIDRFDAAEDRVLRRYHLKAESRFIDVETVEGAARVLVIGDGLLPVVMVPGFGDPGALWAPLIEHMREHRVYVVERPCFGRTGCATHRAETMRQLGVTFLEQVLDGLGLARVGFVANSIGSLWCLWLALDRAERVACMSHVGCPATILGTSAPLPMRLLSVPLVGRLLMALTPPSPKQVRRFAAMAGVDLSDAAEIVDLLVALQQLPHVPRAMRDVVRATVRLRGPRPGVQLGAGQLERVTQPVQYIWGEDDPFGSVATGEAAARLTHAEFQVIAGAGHLPWIKDARRVAQIASPFLRAHAQRAA